jgi:3-oxoacyl-[acyl-carrier-protein] synthase-3
MTMSNRRSFISGTGIGLPSRIIPNSWFNELLEEDVDTWLRDNVAIHERRWCTESESTADLCEQAALQALQNAGIRATDLNLIIIATDTPEYISPSTASVLQHRLGATNAATFDLNTACAGFVTAFDTASKYIAADPQYQHVLIIGAYAMSKYLNLSDKKMVTLFADGAGATILSASELSNVGMLASMQMTRGEYHDWMGIYGGGAKIPITHETVNQGLHQLQFVRKFPKELNPEVWTKMARELLTRIHKTPDDVSCFLMTQININAIFETLDNLQVPRDRAMTIMHDLGYTGSAAIPIALHRAITSGKVQRGDLLMLIGSGGGLAFAGAAVVY